jgi:rubrerythrin
MVVGLRGLIILNDSLRYSLNPPARVLYPRTITPISKGLLVEGRGTMILRANAEMSLVSFMEMERDCLLAQGVSSFLNEKTMDDSDQYIMYVCNKCGFPAHKVKMSSNQIENPVYICEKCDNTSDISKIRIPYSFKLLFHLLYGGSIAMRFETTDNKCEETYTKYKVVNNNMIE